jgi:hypothetical protein
VTAEPSGRNRRARAGTKIWIPLNMVSRWDSDLIPFHDRPFKGSERGELQSMRFRSQLEPTPPLVPRYKIGRIPSHDTVMEGFFDER